MGVSWKRYVDAVDIPPATCPPTTIWFSEGKALLTFPLRFHATGVLLSVRAILGVRD